MVHGTTDFRDTSHDIAAPPEMSGKLACYFLLDSYYCNIGENTEPDNDFETYSRSMTQRRIHQNDPAFHVIKLKRNGAYLPCTDLIDNDPANGTPVINRHTDANYGILSRNDFEYAGFVPVVEAMNENIITRHHAQHFVSRCGAEIEKNYREQLEKIAAATIPAPPKPAI